MRRFLIALLAVAAAVPPAGAQYFGKNKVRYDTFAWKQYATPHFRISFYQREQASLAKLASFTESAYDDLARKFNYQITEPIPLIAYANHAEFEQTNVIEEYIPEGVGAFAVPARNRMVLPIDLPDAELQKLIQHELTHIFQYQILFQGNLTKALTSRAPQWFMEGMASYMANDEDSKARAVIRDAVLSDRVPSIEDNVGGYFAYRFGHMVFQFVESEWGAEGVRDFVFEFRNTLGGTMAKAVKRAFDLDVEEFDARFRVWLRKYYANIPADRGDPREFGPPFRVEEGGLGSVETSPVASPSGDLIAAFSTFKDKDDVDIILLGVPDRKLFRTLTGGYTTRYQYLIAQLLTTGPDRGRDIAFSPSGDRVAVFARRERGRELLMFDVLHGGIKRAYPISVDQAMEPAFSPDGNTIVFHAFAGGRADIYLLDLASGAITNLTQDDAYDSSPVYSPDGKHLVYSSQTGENAKLFEIALDNPKERRQLTFGTGDDEGATFSRDGKRLYFASDRDGAIFDVYGLELATGSLTRFTRVIGAALNPLAVPTRDGERVVYQGYAKGRWQLFVTDPAQGKPAGKEEPPKETPKREPFVPSVSVTINPDKITPVKSRKFFADDVQVLVGYAEDQTLISETYLSFSDHYGDRRINLYLESVSGFSNFALSYVNLAKRLQWGATIFDNRSYYVYGDSLTGRTARIQRAYRETGAIAFAQYPLTLYHRVEGSVGFISQDAAYPVAIPGGGYGFVNYSNNIPLVSAGIIGDTSAWREYGPHAGHRWQLNLLNAFDTRGGTLSRNLTFDGRQYVPLSRRNELAIRLYAATATGNLPSIFYFGGLDTMRGYDYRSLAGNRAAYANVEWRFPMIDHLVLPWLHLRNLRGRFFFDVGGAYFDVPGYKQNFRFVQDGRLKDGVSSYGFGLTANLFGLPMHWDFAKRWDFKQTIGGNRTTFWIGFRY